MKKLLLIFILLFSSPSYAKWTKITATEDPDRTYYIDVGKVKKKDGYVYYWELSDYLKPNEWKHMSSKTLMEGDCNIPRKARQIYANYHSQPMGNGSASMSSSEKLDWQYSVPNSVLERMLNFACIM